MMHGRRHIMVIQMKDGDGEKSEEEKKGGRGWTDRGDEQVCGHVSKPTHRIKGGLLMALSQVLRAYLAIPRREK